MNNYPTRFKGNQQGFSIVMAIFILVVLGLLGVYMVRLSGVQHATSSYALQGARAYQAAKAGLGWATAKIISPPGGTCVDVNAQATLNLPELPGFTVSLNCISASYQEGNDTPSIYQIGAHSEFGAYGSADYVSRELEVSIVK
jgi:MSHA biogenesis protein MshP